MATKKQKEYEGIQETNIDDVEVDEEGNLRLSISSESSESLAAGIGVDKEGKLRLHPTSKLLSPTGDPRKAPDRNDGLSPKERQSWGKTQADKKHYSGEGTAEEAKEMLAKDSGNEDPESKSPASSYSPRSHTHSTASGQDIEMSDFTHPQPDVAVERHDLVSDPELGQTDDSEENRFKRFFHNLTPARLGIVVGVVAVLIGVLLTVSLLPASFVYIEYYEIALARNRLTGKVDRDTVYYPGCYLLTPNVELIRFQSTAHTVSQTLEVFSSDSLAFNLDFSLQYFIKPEELGKLFSKFEREYNDVLEAVIGSSVKNEAVQFSLDNYRLNRSLLEQHFNHALARRLSGNCCPACCPEKCSCQSCVLIGRGCQAGFHVEMRYFQLGAINIPDTVAERFLKQTFLLIEAEREMFIQNHAVETKISAKLKQNILNQAFEISQAAEAKADTILAVAAAEYEKAVQTSVARGLKSLFQKMNLTRQEHQLSFMYVRALQTLAEADNLFAYNFEKLTS